MKIKFCGFFQNCISSFFILLLAILMLTGCNPIHSLPVDKSFSLTQEGFEKAKGYELPYPLFFVSSHTSWEFEEAIRFKYDPVKEIYESEAILVTPKALEKQPFRFKITSLNWVHQFAFTYANATPIESSFGLKQENVVLTLRYFSLYSQDMFLKPSGISRPVKLQFTLKVIDKSLQPRMLMSVKRTDVPL